MVDPVVAVAPGARRVAFEGGQDAGDLVEVGVNATREQLPDGGGVRQDGVAGDWVAAGG